MKKHLHLLFCLLLIVGIQASNARNGIAVLNGNWNNSNTWSFDGMSGLPGCGDTLLIPHNKTVTINSQENYSSCTSGLSIRIEGTLQITTGNKLDLPCNSCVEITSGGILKKSTPGGGTSTLMSICGTNVWVASNGPLAGPANFCTVLPVTLLHFDARPQPEQVDINWTTASEINNDYFVVEHSVDGKTFNDVTNVKGAGSSTKAIEYHCTDYYPTQGVSYYRLKQVDFDGAISYSDIIAVFIKDKSPFDFISVETTMNSTVKIMFTTNSNEICNLQMYELSGGLVFSLDMKVSRGLNKKEIYCPFLKKGIYMLNLSSDDNVVSKKISLIE